MNTQEQYYYEEKEAREKKEELERLKKYIFPNALVALEKIKNNARSRK